MPASTVENQNAMVPRLYRSTGEMFVHGCCVGVANCEHPFCTCGSEKVDVTVAVVASDPQAAVLARPQPCQHSRQFYLRPGTRPFARPCRALPHLCLENSHGISPWALLEADAAKRDGSPASARRVPSMEYLTPKFVWILFFTS